MTEDDFADLLRTLAIECASANLRPRLIGGVAVQRVVRLRLLRTAERDGHEPSDLGETNPLYLASLVRATDDIDLVVPVDEFEKHVGMLRSIGYQESRQVTAPPRRFHAPGATLDLVPLDPAKATDGERADRDLLVALAVLDAWLDAGAESDADTDASLRVASLESLVVLKCVARRSRWEHRDLVDLARIALVDFEDGHVRSRLAAMLPALPFALRDCVRAVRDEFLSMDGSGPSAYLNSIRGDLPRLAYDEELEDEVRRLVRDAVQRLLEVANEG